LEFQIAWDIIVLSTKNHFLYIQIVIQNLEFLGMSEISSQFTFEQLGPSKLMGNLEDKTYPLVRWPQGTANHIVVDWRGGASELVPMKFNQWEKLLLWHHRKLTAPGTLGGLRLLLACCYGSIRSKARRTCGEMPYNVADISVKLLLRKLDRHSTSIRQISANRIRGFYSSQLLMLQWPRELSMHTVLFDLCGLELNLTVLTQMLLISLWSIGWLDFTHNSTTGPQCVVFVWCLGRNEVTLIHRFQFSWLHFFICINCIIFLVLNAICRN
jgi:hypothetical protein